MGQSCANVFPLSAFIFLAIIFTVDAVPSYNVSTCPQPNATTAAIVPVCKCDERCYQYGDCCKNAINVNVTTTVYPSCSLVSVDDGSFYVNRTCTNETYRSECLESLNYTVQSDRPERKIPVTSTITGITYGNVFCALCQNVTDYTRSWKMKITCETYNETISLLTWSKLESRFHNDSWIVTSDKDYLIRGLNKTEKCLITPSLPDSLKTHVRRCYKNLVKTCRSPFNNMQSIINVCQSFRSIVFNSLGVPFNNYWCAICNGYDWLNHPFNVTRVTDGGTKIPVAFTDGSTKIPVTLTTSISSTNGTSKSTSFVRRRFNSRFGGPWSKNKYANMTSSSTVSGTNTTIITNGSSTSTLAENIATNRNTITDRSTDVTSSNPLAVRVSTKSNRYLHLRIRMHCIVALNSINFTKVRVETINYRTFNRTYVRNATIIDGNSIRICRLKNFTFSDTEIDKVVAFFSSLTWYSVKIGAVVALLAIGLHLRAYFSPEYERTSRHKIYASYAFALFVGNAGVVLNSYVGVGSYLWYVGFMSSFFWISSMAFEVSLAAWSVTGNFAVTSQKWKLDDNAARARFRIYSYLSWFGTAAILILVIISHTGGDLTQWDLVILYSYSQDSTFLIFFVLPLTVTMSLNLAFYLCTAYVVYTEPETVDKLTKLGIEYGLHGGIVLTTNAMWTTMALADYLFNDWLTCLYVLLDVVLAYLVYVASPGVNQFTIKMTNKKNVYTVKNTRDEDEK